MKTVKFLAYILSQKAKNFPLKNITFKKNMAGNNMAGLIWRFLEKSAIFIPAVIKPAIIPPANLFRPFFVVVKQEFLPDKANFVCYGMLICA